MNECRDPQPNIGQSCGNTTEEGEGLEKAEELRTPEARSPQNRIKQGSQTLNDQLGSLDGFSLGTLHMCYDCLAWGFCGTLNSGNGDVSDLFAPLWMTFFSAGLPHLALTRGFLPSLIASSYAM